METKRCSKCGRILPLTEFFKCESRKDGVQSFLQRVSQSSQQRIKGETIRQKTNKGVF